MRAKAVMAAALVGFVALGLTAGLLFARGPSPTPSQVPEPEAGVPWTHEDMHAMMDAVHGSGPSARMHEAMGPEAEQHMDECVTMHGMMMGMVGMMGGPAAHPMGGGESSGSASEGIMGMVGMMGGPAAHAMGSGASSGSASGIMHRMMGR